MDIEWRLLSIESHPEADYAHCLEWAHSTIADRDPEDAHPLALAYALNLPLWSNDKDFEGQDVVTYTTAQLLKLLDEEQSA